MRLDEIVCGDFLDIAPTIADSSVNLLVSDWPYYKVKALDWDRQWKTPEEYLDWISRVCEQYRRVLAPNGTLYAFASPEMVDRVSVKIRKWFNVLNHIVWIKIDESTHALKYGDDRFRQYVQKSERIIFAEHYGADNAAKGESGYGAKCDELRGFVFEPLRAYLVSEFKRAGLVWDDSTVITCFMAATPCKNLESARIVAMHKLHPTYAQWQMPTSQQYQAMRKLLNFNGKDYLNREYEDLRAEYEDLRAEYEDLRRPFNVTAQDQYTDVWDFPTVKHYPGKHPCEKPLEMMEHIVRVSSRPGDVVADFFCGSGVALAVAHRMGRHYIGCDLLQKWAKCASQRVERAKMEMAQMELAL